MITAPMPSRADARARRAVCSVLYATDGSVCAALAGRLLAGLPLPTGTRITVLSAVPESGWVEPTLPGAEGALLPLLAEVEQEERQTAVRIAEAAAEGFRQDGRTLAISIWHRSPVDAILAQAREDATDLIVLGSHGKGTVERLLLGSVSERVARGAPCSVMVARGDRLRRAVVAVDGSEASERALDALLRLPLPADMEVTLVYVLRPGDTPAPMQLGPGLAGESVIEEYDRQAHVRGEQIVRHAQAHLRHAGRQAATEVRCGAPAEELIAAAREIGADLIVVGSANRSALGRLFLGSVSSRVLSHAPCSVLVARSTEVDPGSRGGSHESDGPA